MSTYIGLDIGGTKIIVAAADEHGKVLRQERAATSDSLETDLNTLHEMITQAAAGEPLSAIGAAIGGPLDWERGIVSPLHQPAWRNVPLKEIMQARWGCPFWVDVDTNIAALGEYYFTRLSARRFLYITLSTGMGAGFLVDGAVYRGMDGVHPELGHQSIPFRCSNPAGMQCECGVPDCLEALVSGNGIRRIYGYPAEALTPAEWEEIAYNLGQGLRNAVALYAPDVIRLGGGVAVGGGDRLIDQARQVMLSHLRLVPAPEVSLSHLGYETALMGAIAVAMHGLDHPE